MEERVLFIIDDASVKAFTQSKNDPSEFTLTVLLLAIARELKKVQLRDCDCDACVQINTAVDTLCKPLLATPAPESLH